MNGMAPVWYKPLSLQVSDIDEEHLVARSKSFKVPFLLSNAEIALFEIALFDPRVPELMMG